MNKSKLVVTSKDLLVCSIFGIILIAASFYYISAIKNNVEYETSQYLREVAVQGSNIVKEKINRDLDILSGISEIIGGYKKDIDNKEIISFIHSQVKYSDFENISIADLNGKMYMDNGKACDVINKECFSKAIRGKKIISDPIYIPSEKQDFIVLYVPIYKENNVIGMVMGRYGVKKFNDLINIKSFNGEGYSYISKGSGTVFSFSSNNKGDRYFKDIHTDFNEKDFRSSEGFFKMQSHMKNGYSGEVFYKWNGKDKIMSYVPIGINDWYLLSVVPKDIVNNKSAFLFKNALVLCMVIVSVFIIGVSYFVRKKIVYNIKLRKINEELKLNKQRYDIIMDQVKDTVFQWNINDNTIYYSKYFKEKFGYDPVRENFPNSLVDRGSIHKEDINNFLLMWNEAKNGKEYIEFECRIKNVYKDYVWYKFRGTTIYDNNNKAYKVIGVISDIDEQKSIEKLLEEKAKRDSLTELYNKGIAEKLIEDHLSLKEEGRKAALIIIDIDNFKNINDTLGHQYGDEVIKKIAYSIRNVFYDVDIIGRIGGDEFAVFLDGFKEVDILHKKIKMLIDMFSNFLTIRGTEYKVSGSIGVAIYPNDGISYSEIFEKADKALYYAKNNGKDQYVIYGEKF